MLYLLLLKEKGERELDVFKGRFEVKGKKLDLHTLDNSNGVDVELYVGSKAGSEMALPFLFHKFRRSSLGYLSPKRI